MTLEPEERIRFGCWLCWVVFVYMKILSWNTRGLGSKKKRRIVQKVFKFSKSRCCDASGNKESNLGQEVCEQCLKRQKLEVGCSSCLWGFRGDCDYMRFK